MKSSEDTMQKNKYSLYGKGVKHNCLRLVVYEKSNPDTGYFQLIGLKDKVKGTIHKYIRYNTFEPVPTKVPDGYKKLFDSGSWFNIYIGEFCDVNFAK